MLVVHHLAQLIVVYKCEWLLSCSVYSVHSGAHTIFQLSRRTRINEHWIMIKSCLKSSNVLKLLPWTHQKTGGKFLIAHFPIWEIANLNLPRATILIFLIACFSFPNRCPRGSPWYAPSLRCTPVHSSAYWPHNGTSDIRTTPRNAHACATRSSNTSRNAPSIQTHGTRWTSSPGRSTPRDASTGYAAYAWYGRSTTARISAGNGDATRRIAPAIWSNRFGN